MKMHSFRLLTTSITVALFTISLAACGSSSENPSSSSGGSSTTTTTTTATTTDWSALGAKTKTDSAGAAAVNHDDYKVDAHAALSCTDCHAANMAREGICVTCHAFSKYTTSNVNHTTFKTGTQCNKCHYSNSSSPTGNGWRNPNTPATTVAPAKRTRIDHAKWHASVKGTCLDCHSTAAISTFPASTHGAGSGRTTACESCHFYSNGKWAGGHAAVTTGCKTCHSKANHYPGYECETCHAKSISSGFTSWAGASHLAVTSGCTTCHSKHYSGYDCASCHSKAISSGYASWKGWNHRNESSAGCPACHGAGGIGD